ncbi:MAG: hypothetical protein FWE67_06625 [Planctomycetaceae bacterium]|nr:hypothetical protein [Planctomycetaceae bacterium]
MSDNLFDAAVNAADKLTSQIARSTLLSEIARIQFDAGLVDEPLKIVNIIDSPLEKRNVLRNAALDFIQRRRNLNSVPKIIRLMIDTDPQSKYFAGQTAILLLEIEMPAVKTALEVLKTTDEPFDSDRVRYDFITKLLMTGGKDFKQTAQEISASFKSSDYCDWGKLALLKALADWAEWDEAVKIAETFSQLLRRSWAFLELSRKARSKNEKDSAANYFSHAAAVLQETFNSEKKEQKMTQRIAVQLRIFSKEALKNGETDKGMELLEQAEAATAEISSPLERCRQQLFIAKVLQAARALDSAKDYINVKILEDKTLSGIERSRIIQWFLEVKSAGGESASITWTGAVQTAAEAVPKTPFITSDELNQSKRIAEILRRFVCVKTGYGSPSGVPQDDVSRLSGEEYEAYYYSPFALEDCGC